MNDVLFFSARTPALGTELWKSDGTAGGTVLVKDINPDEGGSAPHGFASVNGTIYFAADDGPHGSELWRSDGTEAGTMLLKGDEFPGTADSCYVNHQFWAYGSRLV